MLSQEAANAVLKNGHIVELRPDKTGIAVVEISRTRKTKKAYTESRSERKEER